MRQMRNKPGRTGLCKSLARFSFLCSTEEHFQQTNYCNKPIESICHGESTRILMQSIKQFYVYNFQNCLEE